MSLLGGFERRLERAVEGFFAKVFRSGVHPVEIGKRLLRVMEDGKTVALRRTYAPNVYTIKLSKADYERLAPLETRLVEELEIWVGEAARSRGWVLAGSAQVSFESSPRLSTGEFRVEAEAVAPQKVRAGPPAAAPPTAEQRTAVIGRGNGPTLIVMGEDGPMKTIPLRGRVSIGRLQDNDLVLPDPGVSRHHAEIVQAREGYVLRDLGSTNGTLVNGSTVTEHRLRDGDRAVVGQTVIEYRS